MSSHLSNDDGVAVTYRRRWVGDVASIDVERVSINGRPLVVIDPEDREQVERLARICHDLDGVELDNPEPMTTRGLAMRQALRSLIAPPKPPEPTGLGAVVEDEGGTRWTRVEPAAKAITRNPWYPADDDERQPAEYADIAAVRILSEGVDQ